MPRFYFDLWDGPQLSADEVGIEFSNLEAATQDAIRALGEIVKEDLPHDGHHKDLSIHIRNATGEVLTEVNIEFLKQQPN
jgi:hypothetical protein